MRLLLIACALVAPCAAVCNSRGPGGVVTSCATDFTGGDCMFDSCPAGGCTYGSCAGGNCKYGTCGGPGGCTYGRCTGGDCSYGMCEGFECVYEECPGGMCKIRAACSAVANTRAATAEHACTRRASAGTVHLLGRVHERRLQLRLVRRRRRVQVQRLPRRRVQSTGLARAVGATTLTWTA